MSDPQGPVGEPVEEPAPAGDVVSQAHEGLAEAEAARSGAADDAAADGTSADGTSADGTSADGASADGTSADAVEAGPATETVYAASGSGAVEPVPATEATTPVAAETAAAGAETAAADTDEEPTFATPGLNDAYAADAAAADSTPTVAAEPVPDRHSEAAAVAAASGASASTAFAAPGQGQGQPIFVQAPEEPRPRGNRAAAGGIGLIAAVCFAALYLASDLVIHLVDGAVTGADAGTWLVNQLGSWGLWVPTVVFFLAFWLLGAIINRGRWGVWVILGLLVGLAAYGGHIVGQLFEAPFWNLTVDEGAKVAADQLFAPLAIAALVIGRELTIWFSAWVSARGKRMTELNIEAQREYERTIEAGPQLAR
ncbi:ABC transporter [Microbacterium terrisoli]|uniref:ABC transporter n=1 Tax=Microbacterium terrisoli TaxID=3242192 RepID=UPI002803E2C0|nr:ABC transporter [Microbacterium protaetiae]